MADQTIAVRQRKHTLLPVLSILFLVAYGLMSYLIVEQGNVINSQALLIRQLFTDSNELSSMKAKAAHDRHQTATAKPHEPPKAEAEQQRKIQPQAPAMTEPQVNAPYAPADSRREAVKI